MRLIAANSSDNRYNKPHMLRLPHEQKITNPSTAELRLGSVIHRRLAPLPKPEECQGRQSRAEQE